MPKLNQASPASGLALPGKRRLNGLVLNLSPCDLVCRQMGLPAHVLTDFWLELREDPRLFLAARQKISFWERFRGLRNCISIEQAAATRLLCLFVFFLGSFGINMISQGPRCLDLTHVAGFACKRSFAKQQKILKSHTGSRDRSALGPRRAIFMLMS